MKQKILIVEPDTKLAEQLGDALRQAGYEVLLAADGISGLTMALTESPALVALEANLPLLSGVEVCRQIRRVPTARRLPVILLSAKTEEQERIKGFEAGADDYLAKPFSSREFVLRAGRFIGRTTPLLAPKPMLRVGDFILDELRHEVRVGGQLVSLTSLEFKLIALLMENAGFVLERDRLLDHVWGYGNSVTTRTVDTHVMRLRAKLGKAADSIETIRGVGYRLKEAKRAFEFPSVKVEHEDNVLAAA
jgi:two-component system phosphate regulon response regulator PhoB